MRIFWCMLLITVTATLAAQTRIIPHVTRADGGFATTVIMENTLVSDVEYSLQPYDEDGNPLESVSNVLPGKTTISAAADQLLAEGTASFTIEGEGIFVSVAYASVSVEGSPAHVSESSDHATSYRLFAGDWTTVFDGIAVVNTGQETAPVWVAQRDASGNILQSVRISDGLAPMAKTLFVIGLPGEDSPFQQSEGATYEVYATQNLAITALRGNLPGSNFLWVNDAVPQSRSQITRDSEGIWFIEGGSLYDVAVSMGYSVAEDRLWQMTTFQRAARGTLAEWLGPGAIGADTFARTIGYSDEVLREAFENLEPEAKAMVKGYTDGVNRHVAETFADPLLLPGEFLALRLLGVDGSPVPMTPQDILAMTADLLQRFDPSDFAGGQLTNAALLQDLQERYPDDAAAMFEDLRWINDPNAETMIHPVAPVAKRAAKRGVLPGPLRTDIDFKALAGKYRNLLTEVEDVREQVNATPKMGSYAWVVAGDRTASGNPILYSGPQMGFSAPAVTVEGSIRSEHYNISGMTVPGIPGIIIGRTEHHAWSMQVGHASSADLYVEPPAALGEPVRRETIRVAGSDDVDVPIYETEHGIVLETEPAIIAFRYAHRDMIFDTVQAFYNLSRAESMDEFGQALRNVGVSQHFCYADRDGNIAYWMSGRSPIRPEGEYRLPQGSVAAPLEYDVNVFRDLPHDRNTPVGYYGGWNNKSEVGYDNAPFSDFFYYGVFHRAHSVDDRLKVMVENGNLTFEDVRDLAIDIAATYSIVPMNDPWPFDAQNSRGYNSGGGHPWQFLADFFTEAVESDSNAARQEALEIMTSWDGRFIEGGPLRWVSGTDRADAWMLIDAWIRRVMEHTYDELDMGLAGQSVLFNNLLYGLDDNSAVQIEYDWFSTSNPDLPQDFDAIVVQALDETLAALGERPWGIDQRGFISYEDSLTGQVIHQTPYSSRSTYVHCVEMGSDGPVRIESMFPLGQSGHLLDDASRSMVPFFDTWNPRTFPLFD